MKPYDRAAHEAMLRREMMRQLADWPSGPHVILEPSQADKVAFCEAFIATSRPPGEPARDLFGP